MKIIRKILFIMAIISIIGLIGCGEEEQKEEIKANYIDKVGNKIQGDIERGLETTPEPKKQNYYTDLVETDAQQKEEANQKKVEDFEFAEKMLRVCTQKLQDCTVNISATAEFKCSDENTQTISVGELPTNGKYDTNTVVQITPNASQLSCKQIKTLYRDTTALNTESVILIAQTTADDTWTDNMQFNLYIERPNDNYTNTVTDHLNKGKAYKYLSRDVRSYLNSILAIDIEDISETTDGQVIIKGTTKELFNSVDILNGSNLVNNKDWFNPSTKASDINAVHTDKVLTKTKNNVTLYIDKKTENLVAFEVNTSSDIETITIKGSITDINNTNIEPIGSAEGLVKYKL